MVDRKTNTANAFETTLTADMNTTDTTATVASTVGGPTSPCYLVIDPDVPSKREYVYFNGVFTGTTFVTSALANRHLEGSAASSGLTHQAGAVVRVSPVKQMFDDLHDRIDADRTEVTAEIDGDVAAHAAAADPHPTYTTGAEADAKDTAAIAAHVALADPHPTYTTAAELTTALLAMQPQVQLWESETDRSIDGFGDELFSDIDAGNPPSVTLPAGWTTMDVLFDGWVALEPAAETGSDQDLEWSMALELRGAGGTALETYNPAGQRRFGRIYMPLCDVQTGVSASFTPQLDVMSYSQEGGSPPNVQAVDRLLRVTKIRRS